MANLVSALDYRTNEYVPGLVRSVTRGGEVMVARYNQYKTYLTKGYSGTCLEGETLAYQHAIHRPCLSLASKLHGEGSKVVKRLADGTLPPEILLLILQRVVSKRPCINLVTLSTPSTLTAAYLGSSEASAQLEELFIKAALISGTTVLNCRTDPLALHTMLTSITPSASHRIGHIEIHATLRWSCSVPVFLSHVTRFHRLLQNYPQHFASAKSICLHLDIGCRCRACIPRSLAGWQRVSCRTGFNSFKNLVDIMDEVLHAFLGLACSQKTMRISMRESDSMEIKLDATKTWANIMDEVIASGRDNGEESTKEDTPINLIEGPENWQGEWAGEAETAHLRREFIELAGLQA